MINIVMAYMKICNLCRNSGETVSLRTSDMLDNFRFGLHLLKKCTTIFSKKKKKKKKKKCSYIHSLLIRLYDYFGR